MSVACTRKSTMTCTDITKKLLNVDSTLSISKILNNSNVIGCIKRLGKTADGSPKENLYYYKADMDANPERKRKYMDTGRSARKCTMKDTQYFFKASLYKCHYVVICLRVYKNRFHLNYPIITRLKRRPVIVN